MTRRDYIPLADALLSARNQARETEQVTGVELALSYLCHALENDNPRFAREHFAAVARGERNLHSHPSRNGKGGAR